MRHESERPDDPERAAAPDAGDDATSEAAETRLVALLRGARDHYNVPAAPPPDALWAAIEGRAFGPPAAVAIPIGARRRIPARWRGPAIGLAAGLLLGVGIGAALWRGADAARLAPSAVAARDGAAPPTGVALAAAGDPAYDAVAVEYFDQAVALLATLPTRLDDTRPDARLAAQARDLLSTTRLLLDSPTAGHDAELQALLDDLELVLAQVVRLPAVRDSSQAALIHEALEARDVLPRLRTAAAQASAPMQSFGADD